MPIFERFSTFNKVLKVCYWKMDFLKYLHFFTYNKHRCIRYVRELFLNSTISWTLLTSFAFWILIMFCHQFQLKKSVLYRQKSGLRSFSRLFNTSFYASKSAFFSSKKNSVDERSNTACQLKNINVLWGNLKADGHKNNSKFS